jgi:hypothetical protein
MGKPQVVLPKNATEDDIPEHFRDLGDEVEYVQVEYTDVDPQQTALMVTIICSGSPEGCRAHVAPFIISQNGSMPTGTSRSRTHALPAAGSM